jgi:uncharacterized protein YqgC (DUF456 family)
VPPLETAGLTIVILILFSGIFITIFGLPGTVVIVIDAFLYAWATGFDRIGLKIIALLIVIAVIAESLDFALGAAAPGQFTVSKHGVIAAVIGSIGGVIILTPFLLGLGTTMGMFLGGACGSICVDYISERRLKPAYRTGHKEFLRRILRVLIKGALAIVMTIIVLSAIYS